MLNMLCNPKIKATTSEDSRESEKCGQETRHKRRLRRRKKSEQKRIVVARLRRLVLVELRYSHLLILSLHTLSVAFPSQSPTHASQLTVFFLLCCVLPTQLLLTSLSVSFYMLNMQEAKFR